MASLMDRVRKFFGRDSALTPTPSPAGRGESPAAVVSETGMERFRVERSRIAAIKDCRAMYADDPRVEEMHRRSASDVVRGGFVVKVDDARALQVANDLQTRLDLNGKIQDWVRLSKRDGDSFLELTVNEQLLVSGVTRKPTLQMYRNSNDADQFEDVERAFWMSSEFYLGSEPPKDATWFPVWKIIHARWNHDEESRYGTPMMKSARKHFRYVEDGELNVAVRRKIGGAQIRQHVVEGSEADLLAYKETNKGMFGKLAAVIDLFTNKAGALTVVQGDGNLDKISDVEHHIATMFTASDVPMELIAYGSGLNRDILGEKKDQYEETLRQDRQWVIKEIVKPLLERQWLLQGILPASLKYSIVWRSGKSLSPTDLRDLADAATRLRLLGVKDEIIQLTLAMFMRDVDVDLLNMDGFDAEQFANNLKGLSV